MVVPSRKLATVLNYSAGKQSQCLLWIVLNGEIECPDPFLVLNADPGMENSETYRHIEEMRERCRDAGIEMHTVPGPNLYRDLVQLRTTKKSRLDNPPYWIKKPNTKGQLRQKCTSKYKIEPMDRFLREWLREKYGIPSKGRVAGYVEKWIGFTRDEAIRIKPSPRQYIRFRYPLIELNMNKGDVMRYYMDRGLEIPPRSVCNACFANAPGHYRDMAKNRPKDWQQAVEVDESIRDLSQIGVVEGPAYVSDRLIPLKQLEKEGFRSRQMSLFGDDAEMYSCDGGYCFV